MPRERLRAEPGRVDHRVDREFAAFAAGEPHDPAGLRVDQPIDLGVERDRAAAILDVALHRAHEGVAVDDAGVRRMQRGDGVEMRLHRAGRGAVDHVEAFDAVDLALLEDRLHLATSPSSVATISLPQRRCGTPCEAQKS